MEVARWCAYDVAVLLPRRFLRSLPGDLMPSKAFRPQCRFAFIGASVLSSVSCGPPRHQSIARRSYKGRADVFAHDEIVPFRLAAWRRLLCASC